MIYYKMNEEDYNSIVKIFNKKMAAYEEGNNIVEKVEDNNDNEDEDKLQVVKNKKKRKTTTISLSEKQSRKSQRSNE